MSPHRILLLATLVGAILLAVWNGSSVAKITASTSTLPGQWEPVAPTASRPPAPDGFALRGACDLRALREQGVPVDIAMFVKHGVHSSRRVPKSCTRPQGRLRVTGFVPRQRKDGKTKKRVRTTGLDKVRAFVRTDARKVLPVRGQASFYKSVFNHVCSSDSNLKRRWRKKHRVDCAREGEFARMLGMDALELRLTSSPFLLKDSILQSPAIENVMLIDYACLPTVVNALCDEPMPSYENLTGVQANSAAGQNYTDYWAMHNHTPHIPFNPFWDDIYKHLQGECCLEFTRLN